MCLSEGATGSTRWCMPGRAPRRGRYDVRGALAVAGAAIATGVAINLPFAIAVPGLAGVVRLPGGASGRCHHEFPVVLGVRALFGPQRRGQPGAAFGQLDEGVDEGGAVFGCGGEVASVWRRSVSRR